MIQNQTIKFSKLCIALCISVLLCSFKSDSSGISFLEVKFNKAFRLSKERKQLLFIYVGTEHCDMCQKMKPVMENYEVGCMYNTNFVCISMDPDIMSNNLRLGNWGVYQTPSFVFIGKKKEVIYKASGVKDAREMLSMGMEALEAYKQSFVNTARK